MGVIHSPSALEAGSFSDGTLTLTHKDDIDQNFGRFPAPPPSPSFMALLFHGAVNMDSCE